jgi:hypothetical protein
MDRVYIPMPLLSSIAVCKADAQELGVSIHASPLFAQSFG